MKARVKDTGEIGIVTRIDVLLKDDFASFSSNKVEILQNYADATIDPDYWTRLEHQYAGMAMQGMIKTYEQMMRSDIECRMDCCEHVDTEVANGILRSHADACAEFCIEFAHAIIQKLKEKEERK